MGSKKHKNPVRYNNPCCGGCSENVTSDCTEIKGDCLILCNIMHEVKVDPCGGTFSVNLFPEGVKHILADCDSSTVQLSIFDHSTDYMNLVISSGVLTGATTNEITMTPSIQVLAKCGDKSNVFEVNVDIKNLCLNAQCDPSCEECDPCTGECKEVEIELVGEEVEINKDNC